MSQHPLAGGPPAQSSDYERFTVDRDNGPPLEFDGVLLGAAEEGDQLVRTRAAVYRTKGGKFITEFSRYQTQVVAWSGKPPKLFDKAGVFSTLDEAASFFRPGRLTNELFRTIGVKRTEFVE